MMSYNGFDNGELYDGNINKEILPNCLRKRAMVSSVNVVLTGK